MGSFNKKEKFKGKDFTRSRKFGSKSFGNGGDSGSSSSSSGFKKKSDGFRKFEEKRSDNRSGSSDRGGFQLTEVNCDACGKRCDVPFKPTGSKPIYCRNCFKNGGDSAPRRESWNSQEEFDSKSSSHDSVSQADIDKINRKLDKIMKALKIE